MTNDIGTSGARKGSPWRKIGWGIAAGLLLLPLVAMLLGADVNWTVGDFLIAGLLFGSVGLALELTVRVTRNSAFRGGVAVALAATFLLIWINGAVGIIGSEDNPNNLMYFAVILIALIGSVIALFRPEGMARAMVAAAIAQVAVPIIALVNGTGATDPNTPWDFLFLSGFFAAMWILAAGLFRKAARDETPARAAR